MKTTICLLFFFLTGLTYSQKTVFDKKIYVYKTYQDFVNNVAEEKGELDGCEWRIFSGTKILLKSYTGNERDSFMAKDMWGFKIGNFIFRTNGNSNYPVCVIKQKGKYFYSTGELQLYRIKFDSPNMSMPVEGKVLFYSDDLDSEIFEINKLKSKEKDNSEYQSLVECLKKAKKRHTDQGVLNSTIECIESF